MKTETVGTRETPTSTVDRVSMVLESFDGRPRMTLAGVARRTGIPRSSVHRLLERLTVLGWLHREGIEYELGPKLMEFGATALLQNRLNAAAAPMLRELHRVTGHVVHFGILVGQDVLYLDKIGGRMAADLPTRVGGKQPAALSAIGKVLLAANGRSEDAPRELRQELDSVLDRGVAYEVAECRPGFGSIGVPVGSVGGAVAAVSVCGPMTHLQFDHRHAAPVRMTASALSRYLTTEELIGTAGRTSDTPAM